MSESSQVILPFTLICFICGISPGLSFVNAGAIFVPLWYNVTPVTVLDESFLSAIDQGMTRMGWAKSQLGTAFSNDDEYRDE